MGKNEFVVIDPDLFFNNFELITVNFSENMIEFIPGNLFVNNDKLQTLDLAYNNIFAIGDSLLDSLPNLKSLSFYANECIDASFENIDDFEVIYLALQPCHQNL